ncbi:uncharacterized protein LOC144153280 [Haemaphysalis longicornis]
MSHVLSDNAYYCEESKDEFKKAETRPGIHIYNPKTPVALHLPGGIQKFNDIFMEATFPKDMKTAVYDWWWSKTMDFPLYEVTIEQFTEGKLQYLLEDYNTKTEAAGNNDFYYNLGEETRTKFLYDVKDRYLVVRINGRYALFELLDRFADATPYDRFYIKGDIDIKVIRVVYEEPLPVPLSLPLTSAGILKGDRYQIKGKNPRNAKEFRLVFGDASLDVPLSAEQDEVVLDVTGVEDGRCSAKLNGVELPGTVVKGPFLTERMVLEGDLDFHWVTIVKAGSAAGLQALEQGNKSEAKEQATAAKPKEDTSKKDGADKA